MVTLHLLGRAQNTLRLSILWRPFGHWEPMINLPSSFLRQPAPSISTSTRRECNRKLRELKTKANYAWAMTAQEQAGPAIRPAKVTNAAAAGHPESWMWGSLMLNELASFSTSATSQCSPTGRSSSIFRHADIHTRGGCGAYRSFQVGNIGCPVWGQRQLINMAPFIPTA